MNKQDWVEGFLFGGFRLVAVCLVLAGGLGLVFQLAESWYHFDPNYLGAFLVSTLLRPCLVALTGILLYALSSRMARGMACRFQGEGK